MNKVYFWNGTLYVATDGGLSISTDGGATFGTKTTTNGLAADRVNAFFVSDRGYWYVGTSGGLLTISTDGRSLQERELRRGILNMPPRVNLTPR